MPINYFIITFFKLSNELGGLSFYEDESGNKFVVGADSVPKKLDNISKTVNIGLSGSTSQIERDHTQATLTGNIIITVTDEGVYVDANNISLTALCYPGGVTKSTTVKPTINCY